MIEMKFYAIRLPARATRFDGLSMSLHWITVLLVIGQFASIWLLNVFADRAADLVLAHRSLGIVTWAVVVVRLFWRLIFADLPPFPASMPKVQQWTAKLNEYLLYVLLLVQPLTGLASLLFRGRPFALFFTEAPAILQRDRQIAHTLQSVHESGAWALLVLIGIHAAAALLHGLVFRDGVLQRMLPRFGRRDESGEPLDAELGAE